MVASTWLRSTPSGSFSMPIPRSRRGFTATGRRRNVSDPWSSCTTEPASPEARERKFTLESLTVSVLLDTPHETVGKKDAVVHLGNHLRGGSGARRVRLPANLRLRCGHGPRV